MKILKTILFYFIYLLRLMYYKINISIEIKVFLE
jgi:hypothetical protein